MNKVLLDFYSGVGADNRNRSFEEIIELGDNFLERSHDIIQWLFPLTEPSMHNPHAPLLDQETIDAMIASPECMLNLKIASLRFFKFLGRIDDDGKPVWVSQYNHNYLRITRVIRCLKLFGQLGQATAFYKFALSVYNRYPEEVGAETLAYWIGAIEDAQETSQADQNQ